jgi:hypothetical protein
MDELDQLRLHTAKEREAARLRRALTEQRRALVKSAFERGFTGPQVATAAGCSKQMAYKLRDQAG